MNTKKSHKWRITSPVARAAVLVGSAVALVATVGAPSKWF